MLILELRPDQEHPKASLQASLTDWQELRENDPQSSITELNSAIQELRETNSEMNTLVTCKSAELDRSKQDLEVVAWCQWV